MKLIDIYEGWDQIKYHQQILRVKEPGYANKWLSEQAAKYKSGNFYVNNWGITTLKGAPKTISGIFDCSKNKLKSLIGAPSIVKGNFICFDNKLKSLKDIHKIIKEIDGVLEVSDNPIKSHVLGVLYIQGLKKISLDNIEDSKAQDIINSYLPNTRGHKSVFECQCALQDASFDELAQL